MEKLVKITDTGIRVLSDEVLEDIKKKNLSPSMVEAFLVCPADWLMETFILPKLEHETQIHLIRGNLFHSVMEHFFALEGKERMPKALGKICHSTLNDDYSQLQNDQESIHWLATACRNYLSMGFNYQKEQIAQVKLAPDKEPQVGLECFVKGQIGNTRRPVLGFVDRTTLDRDGRFIIDDWKTGRSVHIHNPKKKTSQENSFGYIRQQTIYAMLYEQLGYDVSAARLIYPVAKQLIEVPFQEEEIRKQVIADLELVDQRLDICLEKNIFPFGRQIFCSWCKEFYPGYKGRAKAPRVNQNQLVSVVDYGGDELL